MDKKMRLIIRSLLLCGILSLTACTQDETTIGQDTQLPEGVYPLEIMASGLDVVATPVTRGTVDGDWKDVDFVAVSDNAAEAKKYKVTSSDTYKSALLSAAEGVTPFYWQSSTETKPITAWYPYSDAYPGDSWKVQANQSGDGYQASDLIYGTLDLPFTNQDQSMTFKHQTAKIVVKIDKDKSQGNFTEEQLKAATVQIINITGVENGGNSITAMYPAGDYGRCALVMPQEIKTVGQRLFSFKIDGNDHFYYTVPTGGIKWEAGNQYTYTITIKADGVTATASDPIGWDTGGGSGSGSITWPTEIDLSNGKDINISDDGNYLITGTGTKGITISGGNPTVIFHDVQITAGTALNITGGSPKLVFNGTTKLESISSLRGAISLSNNANVEISGSGTLNVKADNSNPSWFGFCAVIGSAYQGSCGNISISGVTLRVELAEQPVRGVGIGASASGTCGDITISNAAITITKLVGGAGIGTSIPLQGTSSCGAIRISNTDINILYGNYSAYQGAAIGCAPEMMNTNASSVRGIYIKLKEGQSQEQFLEKLTTTTAKESDKVGQGWDGNKKSGTITDGVHWYNADGSEIIMK